MPAPHTSSSDLRDDLGEVLSAGGEVPRSSEAHQVMKTPAIHQSRNPRATTAGRHTLGADSLVPLSAETEQSGGLDNFVERCIQNLREVRLALEKQHKLRVTARARANASISRPSAGVALEKGSLVLVRESESSRHRDRSGELFAF